MIRNLLHRKLKYFKLKPGQKVNSFIVGAQKGGTSSLYGYLQKSPQVSCSHKKEIGFFSQENIYELGTTWYEGQFTMPAVKPEILLDATPEYLYYPSVAERINNYNSGAKIIILLRNPVTRAYSHYNMFRQLHSLSKYEKSKLFQRFSDSGTAEPMIKLLKGVKFPEFMDLLYQEKKIDTVEPSFIRRGLYYFQVKRYLELFSKEQILILDSLKLMEDKLKTLKDTCFFLGISTDFVNRYDLENEHVSIYNKELTPDEKKFLNEVYQEPNEKLFDLIGKRFDWNDQCN